MVRSKSRSRSRSAGYSKSRSRSRSRSAEEEEGYRVHVSDLGMHPIKRDIERAFEKYGPLVEVWLARNPPCFAFIKFKYRDDAESAIRELDGTELCNNRIRVSQARPRTRGRRPRTFDPNLRCYSCGDRGHFSRDCDFHRQRSRTRSRSRSRSRGRRRRSGSQHRRSDSRRRRRSGSREQVRQRNDRSNSRSKRSISQENDRRRSGEKRSERDREITPADD